MYQALYRKYRPLTFEDVYGQEVIIKILKNAILKEKVSHAYLFTGPRGTGKTTVAKIMGKVLNCSHLSGSNPCDECISCLQFNSKQNTDIIEIDAASNNGVDEIRELKSKVNLVPSYGKYKIYIIDEVHMLTIGAFNALLKTLEEPPPHAIFILATTDPHKIPSTILSRCQRLDFKKISIIKIAERLKYICEKENIIIDDLAVNEIARLSDGGMRDSISILDQLIAYADNKISTEDVHEINGTLTRENLSHFIKKIIQNDITSSLNMIDHYDDNGKNIIKLAEEIILFLKDILIFKTIPNFIIDDIDTKIYEDISNIISIETLYKLIKEFNESLSDMKNSNNPKLMFELSVIKIIKIDNDLFDNNIIVNSTQNKKMYINEQKKEYKFSNENINEQKEQLKTKDLSITDSFDNLKNKTIDENSIDVNINNNKYNNTIDLNLKDKLKEVKQVRINNTLFSFDKTIFIEIKNKLEDIRSLILNERYSHYASIVLDGQLKASSSDHMIFVYESENISDLFNENIIIIEKMIAKVLKKEYKIISTTVDEWNIIKKEFNSKTKKYNYIDEKFNLKELLKKNTDELKRIFGDIVEYK